VDFWKTNAEVEFSPIIDGAAAVEAASLAAARQKSGRSVDMRDTQIAGISPLAIKNSLVLPNSQSEIGELLICSH